MDDDARNDLLALTADIVTAHVANDGLRADDLPGLISTIHAALAGLLAPPPQAPAAAEPAVRIRASIRPDHLVCLEDGRKLKMLKRYLRTHYAMTPADYRAKWGLPAGYPMVAPAYAEQQHGLARQIGFGRKQAPSPAPRRPGSTDAPRRRGRPRKTPAPAGA